MAADDDQSSADPGMPGSPGDPNVPSDAPDYPEAGAPKAQPAQTEPDKKSQENLSEARNKAYIEQLEKNYYDSAQRGQKMFGQLQGALGELMALRDVPFPGPPHQTSPPPPPTEQQKGGASEFIMNLLKFGALTAVAFGTGGRGYGHNAIWKSAIGAALTGYAQGRKDVTDKAMQVWEKNREIINDANKEQNANYRAILADHRTDLGQKMDLINGLSKAFGDYRTFQASQNKNLMDLQKSIADQEKLQHDKEQWEIKSRDKIYDILGKNNITHEYLGWLHDKSGGKTTLTENSSVEDWRKVETDHPEWTFSEFLRFHEQEEIRKATEKVRATEKERIKAKSEAEAEKEKEEKRIKPGGTKEDPLGLGLGQ